MATEHTKDESTTEHAVAESGARGAAPRVRSLLALQGRAGNRAASRLIQTKLTVGAAGDRYEQEADSVAEAVMRALRQPLDRTGEQTEAADHPLVARAGAELPMRRILRAKPASTMVGLAGGQVDDATDIAIQRARGGGAPLDDTLRRSMEAGFGADFSRVRVHDDANSHQINTTIQARAFTTGSDIFFGKEGFSPTRPADQELVAHELTHVVQQGGADVVHRQITETLIQRGGGYGKLDEGGKKGAKPKKPKKKGEHQQLLDDSDEDSFGDGEDDSGDQAIDPRLAAAVEVVAKTETALIEKVAGGFNTYVANKKSGSAGSGESEASGGKEAEFTLTREGTDLIAGIKYIAEASARAGVQFTASGEVGCDLGPFGVKAAGKLKAFAGIAGKATGSIQLGLLTGFVAEFSAEGMVGVEVSAEGMVEVSLGDLGVAGELWGRLFAGGEAEASGTLSVTRKGISMSGKVEAFAGVKAEGKGEISLKFRGRKIITLKGKASAMAGAGGSVEGEFTISNGKIAISASVAAVLGIGGELGGSIEIDLDALADAIYEAIRSLLEKDGYTRFLDPFDAVNPIAKELRRYKAVQEKKGKKLEAGRVQQIVDSGLKAKKQLKSPEFDLVDMAIDEALADALGVNGTNFSWQVSYKSLRSFQQHGV